VGPADGMSVSSASPPVVQVGVDEGVSVSLASPPVVQVGIVDGGWVSVPSPSFVHVGTWLALETVVGTGVGLPVELLLLGAGLIVGDAVGTSVGSVVPELGDAVGLPVDGLAVGSESMGTTVLGASVLKQMGEQGTVAVNATVLCPSGEARSPQAAGVASVSPEAMSPLK